MRAAGRQVDTHWGVEISPAIWIKMGGRSEGAAWTVTGDGLDPNATETLTSRTDPVVSVRGLVKRYGRREAVRGIDLEVNRGEIFAFLGPNGAGKSTTVEILEGFGVRTEGDVRVLGVDPAEAGGAWRDRVGVVLQESEPEPGLSVRECLELYAGDVYLALTDAAVKDQR
jgi:ABC-2 type transport system ATP-binding protein